MKIWDIPGEYTARCMECRERKPIGEFKGEGPNDPPFFPDCKSCREQPRKIET